MSTAAPFLLAVLLSSVVLTDVREGLIRNWNTLALLICGLGVNAIEGGEEVLSSLIGSLAGGGSLLLVSVAYRAVRKRDGIGMGDIKFMFGAGSWVFAHGVAPLLLLASLVALLAVVIGAAPRTFSQSHIAFGPFLSIACFGIYSLQNLGLAPWMA